MGIRGFAITILVLALFISTPSSDTEAIEAPEVSYFGSYTVSTLDIIMKMTTGSTITVTVYYPGFRGPLDRYYRDQAAPFPVSVFSPGYGGSATDYGSLLEEQASLGFIVAGASWAYCKDREMDTAHIDHTIILDALEEYNEESGNPLNGLVDTAECSAYGHSRGGRAAFMASGEDNRIKHIVAWMPTLNNGSNVNQKTNKLLFGGEKDDIASPSEWLDPLYYSSTGPFIYANVLGGDHSPTLETHWDITLKFFRYHQLGETELEPEVYGDEIRSRAEDGEFHLRINASGKEYDSHPHLSFNPFDVPFMDKMQPIEEKDSPTILIFLPILLIAVMFRTLNRERKRSY